MKRLNIFSLCVFAFLFFSPILNSVLKFSKPIEIDENRALKKTVRIDINNLDKLPKDLNEYINDNFTFRNPFIKLHSYIQFSIFKKSPYPDKTLIGKDGWCFLAGDHRNQFEGKDEFSKNELIKIRNKIRRSCEHLDSLNIKCYFMIAPYKHSIYSDKLPLSINSKSKSNNLKRLNSLLNNTIIDPVPHFLKLKEQNKLFYKLDNHWNYVAGMFATDIIMDRIKNDFPNLKNTPSPNIIWTEDSIKSGYHYRNIGIYDLSEVDKKPLENHNIIEKNSIDIPFSIPSNFPFKDDYLKHFINKKAPSNLKLLFIRDSFGAHMVPFLTEYFAESLVSFDAWEYKINATYVEEFKPDIIIIEIWNPLLKNMLE